MLSGSLEHQEMKQLFHKQVLLSLNRPTCLPTPNWNREAILQISNSNLSKSKSAICKES